MPDRAEQFDFIMIKPSHYDDDGYPIVWWRTILPSNSLAALNGLARDAAERAGAGAGRRASTWCRSTSATSMSCPARIITRHQAARRQGADRPGRRPVEPVPPRARPRPRVPRGGAAGGDRRLPRLGLPRRCSRRSRPRSRKRSTSAARCSPARPRRGGSMRCSSTPGKAGSSRSTITSRTCRASPACPVPWMPQGVARAQFGAMVELRSRPRLPVPVQLLHDHQRPGPQEPLPHRRRPRRDHPRESRAGDQGLLHHRRQSRPQPPLGGVLRPADQAATRRRGSRPTSPSRSTRSATASPISSTRPSAPG